MNRLYMYACMNECVYELMGKSSITYSFVLIVNARKLELFKVLLMCIAYELSLFKGKPNLFRSNTYIHT